MARLRFSLRAYARYLSTPRSQRANLPPPWRKHKDTTIPKPTTRPTISAPILMTKPLPPVPYAIPSHLLPSTSIPSTTQILPMPSLPLPRSNSAPTVPTRCNNSSYSPPPSNRNSLRNSMLSTMRPVSGLWTTTGTGRADSSASIPTLSSLAEGEKYRDGMMTGFDRADGLRRQSTVKQIRRRSGVALSTYSTHSQIYAPV